MECGVDSKKINIAIFISSELETGGRFQYEYKILDILKKYHKDQGINLKFYGLNFQISSSKIIKSDKLLGSMFVVSGVFSQFSRDELKLEIEKNGGKVKSSISTKTSYVIAGDNMGPSKRLKAESLNVAIISEEDFVKMIK